MSALLKRFLSDEKGLETIEYALVGSLLVIAAVVGLSALGTKVATEWPKVTALFP